ncbi:hypothetical protein ABZ468_44330 [Streptomyces sp. NPDC005708]|uniref:hypothetical protein n=1 Tax=Streptomyces sp. NPDC005708 TaxID=3154564 RepID=UPI0033E9D92E
MVMPQDLSITSTQLCVSPPHAQDSRIHGARVSQEDQADVRVELTQVSVELLFLQFHKPKI